MKDLRRYTKKRLIEVARSAVAVSYNRYRFYRKFQETADPDWRGKADKALFAADRWAGVLARATGFHDDCILGIYIQNYPKIALSSYPHLWCRM